MNIPKPGDSSHWGPILSVTEAAPGLWFVSTASHGGYLAAPGVWSQMPAELAAITTPYSPPVADGRAYEEDADWAILCIAVPHLFTGQDCFNAVRMIRSDRKPMSYAPFVIVAEWLDAHPGSLAEAKARAFMNGLAGLWENCGCACGPDREGYQVHLRRDKTYQTVTFRDYPSAQFYRDDQIEEQRNAITQQEQEP